MSREGKFIIAISMAWGLILAIVLDKTRYERWEQVLRSGSTDLLDPTVDQRPTSLPKIDFSRAGISRECFFPDARVLKEDAWKRLGETELQPSIDRARVLMGTMSLVAFLPEDSRVEMQERLFRLLCAGDIGNVREFVDWVVDEIVRLDAE